MCNQKLILVESTYIRQFVIDNQVTEFHEALTDAIANSQISELTVNSIQVHFF